MSITNEQTRNLKILVSTLAAKVLPEATARRLIAQLIEQPDVAANVLAIAQAFGKPELTRSFNLTKSAHLEETSLELDFHNTQVSYQGQVIGTIKILFKSPLPGELQARLAIESAIDRFLEYLQKVYQIVVIDESDRHVQVFIPNQSDNSNPDFDKFWEDFIEKVAFSTYGLTKLQLPGLAQTFISMLKSVTLSERGFSTLEVPILSRQQANLLAAWYFGVWRDTKKRQDERQKKKINVLTAEIEKLDLSDKDCKSKLKQLEDAQKKQVEEAKKYTEDFQKSFGKSLEEQKKAYQELASIQSSANKDLSKPELKKLQKQQEKINEKLIFSQEFVQEKIELLKESGGNPLELVERDREQHPEKFRHIAAISNHFDKTATDQISGTRGDIFAKCITEMYRLMEMTDEQFDSPPPPLLTEHPIFQVRSPGDDSKEFCYSCGAVLKPETAKWQVRRLIFESPEQRRQSASGEGRPQICSSCSALAFASPLKVTNESIVLRLEPNDGSIKSGSKLKDYLRMLTNKEMHLSAGRYIVLASEKTQSGDSAAQKMGQVQYARTKAASIFPREVLNDFKFYLLVQGTEIPLLNRHLIFIKGLIEGYGQSVILAGKEVNKILGNAVRYVEQDFPVLAEYTLAREENSYISHPELEQVRAEYYQQLWKDVGLKETNKPYMNADHNGQSLTRAKLYRDVAALTGLLMPFAEVLEKTVRDFLQQQRDKYSPEQIKKEVEREVSKLIENVHDATSFCYYATKGDDRKTSVSARLYLNRENHFIYRRVKELLEQDLQLTGREEENQKESRTWLNLYADDILMAYAHFAAAYADDKDWKDLTYQLKLSLYTRFPELVRKLKSSSEG